MLLKKPFESEKVEKIRSLEIISIVSPGCLLYVLEIENGK